MGKALSLLGIVIGLAGVYLALDAKKAKEPVYTVSGMNLTDTSVYYYGKLKVSFDGKPIPRATVTSIRLWNAGKLTIRDTDLVDSDPITISVQDGKILLAEVHRYTGKGMVARITGDTSQHPKLRFNFLAPDQEIIIRVLHTASDPTACSVTGTVLDSPKGIRQVQGALALPDTARNLDYRVQEQQTMVVVLTAFGTLLCLSVMVVKWFMDREDALRRRITEMENRRVKGVGQNDLQG